MSDDLFSTEPFPATEDVEGETAAALLGDASPVRGEPEAAEQLAAAGVPVVGEPVGPASRMRDRCPSCGVALPDPSHPVDASLRNRRD